MWMRGCLHAHNFSSEGVGQECRQSMLTNRSPSAEGQKGGLSYRAMLSQEGELKGHETNKLELRLCCRTKVKRALDKVHSLFVSSKPGTDLGSQSVFA